MHGGGVTLGGVMPDGPADLEYWNIAENDSKARQVDETKGQLAG